LQLGLHHVIVVVVERVVQRKDRGEDSGYAKDEAASSLRRGGVVQGAEAYGEAVSVSPRGTVVSITSAASEGSNCTILLSRE